MTGARATSTAIRRSAPGSPTSCAGCHGRPRGSAGHGGNTYTRPDSRDARHLFGLGLQEMLADEITTELRQIRADAITAARSTRMTQTVDLVSSKGPSYGQIVVRPNVAASTRPASRGSTPICVCGRSRRRVG